MFDMTTQQAKIHERAQTLAKRIHSDYSELVEVLRDIEQRRVRHCLGKKSLFVYATECLKLDDGIAYALVTLARKTLVNPQLRKAIAAKTLSVSKASRIVSQLNAENTDELIHFAETHTKRNWNLK